MPEWLMGTDCKSVDFRLHRFKSYSTHLGWNDGLNSLHQFLFVVFSNYLVRSNCLISRIFLERNFYLFSIYKSKKYNGFNQGNVYSRSNLFSGSTYLRQKWGCSASTSSSKNCYHSRMLNSTRLWY